MVPKRENKYPKLLGLLETASVKTSGSGMRGDSSDGFPPKGSGPIRDGVWLTAGREAEEQHSSWVW